MGKIGYYVKSKQTKHEQPQQEQLRNWLILLQQYQDYIIITIFILFVYLYVKRKVMSNWQTTNAGYGAFTGSTGQNKLYSNTNNTKNTNGLSNGPTRQNNLYQNTTNNSSVLNRPNSLIKGPNSNLNYGVKSHLSSTNKPIGLENLTNTCYISACLQILFLVIPETMKSGKVTQAFLQLKKTHDKRDYHNFKEVVQKEIQIVQGWNQQDAQQFLISFLQVLNRENSKQLKGGSINLNYNEKETQNKNWRLFVENMEKIENSDIIKLFYGQILRRFQCPKNHKKHKFERYLSVSLSFPDTKSSGFSAFHPIQNITKMQDMIQKEFSPQFIEDIICQQCKKKCQFKKTSILYTLPKVLIIHFSRFRKGYYSEQKITNYVQFDQFLQLKQQQSGEIVSYNLMGIIHHYGSLNRGHYFADVKIDGNWFECDDDKVSLSNVNLKGNQSKYAYILVYKREK